MKDCASWGLNLCGCGLSARGGVSQEANKLMEEKFKSGKNRWFFSKLRF